MTREQKLYDALKTITGYMSPEELRRHAEEGYGLHPHEAVEMAYENVLATARDAIRGMKRPATPTTKHP